MRGTPCVHLGPKLVLRAQSNGIAVRKDATELRDWLDVMIYDVNADGELATMDRKTDRRPAAGAAGFLTGARAVGLRIPVRASMTLPIVARRPDAVRDGLVMGEPSGRFLRPY